MKRCCWMASILLTVLHTTAGAQEAPPMRKGVSVQLAQAGHAVEMRAADEANATIVALTAAGKLYIGVEAADSAALSALTAATVYVKADARAPYQQVLTVLDALRGKTVVLLTASPAGAARQGYVPPYGIRLTLPR